MGRDRYTQSRAAARAAHPDPLARLRACLVSATVIAAGATVGPSDADLASLVADVATDTLVFPSSGPELEVAAMVLLAVEEVLKRVPECKEKENLEDCIADLHATIFARGR